jgi:DNA polymerase I-like protein with 3'-5' exonuclease and polymerase domains
MDRQIVTFDVETYKIAPGRAAPPIVCLSWSDGDRAELLHREDGLRWLRRTLDDDRFLLGNQNIAFDLACAAAADPDVFLPLIFDAYEANRIACIMIRQQQTDIATGEMNKASRYDLETTVQRLFGEHVAGKHGADAWRLRYRELEGTPIRDWPEEAKRYVLDDSRLARRVLLKQMELGELPDVERQYRAGWVLQLMKCWGIRTDGESVDALETRLHLNVDDALKELTGLGIYRVGGTKREPKLVKSTKEVKRLVEADLEAAGLNLLEYQTGTGETSTALETLEKCRHPALQKLAEISGDQKLLNTYIPLLRRGCDFPIHPFWNALVKSGRTSCSDPNLQNQPRKPGVRECFVPRPGWFFISCDYHTAELRSLAQVLMDAYGESAMAEALRAGRDLHLVTGASILGVTYDEIRKWYKGPHAPGCGADRAGEWHCAEGCFVKKAKDARQLSKAANFGLPGGLGAATFVDYAAGPDYRVSLTLERSQEIKDAWLNAYPEMIQYFQDIGRETNNGGGSFELIQPRSGRIRGDCGFTDGANSMFQGLTADGMKDAAFHVAREMYDPRLKHSPLYGSRMVALIHDELFCESPEHLAAEAGERVSEIMVERMSAWLPDIPVTAEPALMRRWSKAAGDAVRDKGGRLIPWEDRAA